MTEVRGFLSALVCVLLYVSILIL